MRVKCGGAHNFYSKKPFSGSNKPVRWCQSKINYFRHLTRGEGHWGHRANPVFCLFSRKIGLVPPPPSGEHNTEKAHFGGQKFFVSPSPPTGGLVTALIVCHVCGSSRVRASWSLLQCTSILLYYLHPLVHVKKIYFKSFSCQARTYTASCSRACSVALSAQYLWLKSLACL